MARPLSLVLLLLLSGGVLRFGHHCLQHASPPCPQGAPDACRADAVPPVDSVPAPTQAPGHDSRHDCLVCQFLATVAARDHAPTVTIAPPLARTLPPPATERFAPVRFEDPCGLPRAPPA